MVILNHTTIPANLLESLARDLLENVGQNGTDPDQDAALETKAAQALMEAARMAQSAAARREKETVVKVPLMPLSAAVDQGILLPRENWLNQEALHQGKRTTGRALPGAAKGTIIDFWIKWMGIDFYEAVSGLSDIPEVDT